VRDDLGFARVLAQQGEKVFGKPHRTSPRSRAPHSRQDAGTCPSSRRWRASESEHTGSPAIVPVGALTPDPLGRKKARRRRPQSSRRRQRRRKDEGWARVTSTPPFPCRSGKLRVKFFFVARPAPKTIYDQHVTRDSSAESKARQGNGRETRKPPIAHWHRSISAIILTISIDFSAWLLYGPELRVGKRRPNSRPN
jgi:hypothetical protein